MYTQEAHLAGAVQAYLNGMPLDDVVKLYGVTANDINATFISTAITSTPSTVVEDLPHGN